MKPKRSINSFQLLPDASSREEEIKSAVLKERESNASEAEQDKSKLKPTLVSPEKWTVFSKGELDLSTSKMSSLLDLI